MTEMVAASTSGTVLRIWGETDDRLRNLSWTRTLRYDVPIKGDVGIGSGRGVATKF